MLLRCFNAERADATYITRDETDSPLFNAKMAPQQHVARRPRCPTRGTLSTNAQPAFMSYAGQLPLITRHAASMLGAGSVDVIIAAPPSRFAERARMTTSCPQRHCPLPRQRAPTITDAAYLPFSKRLRRHTAPELLGFI